VEDSLEAFRSELAEIRKEINVEIISSLIEELDAAGTDSASSRGEIIVGQVAGAGGCCRPFCCPAFRGHSERL
jgi:hypothetical protein